MKSLKKIAAASMASLMAVGTLASAVPAAEQSEYKDYSNGFEETVTLSIPVYERGWEGWNPCDNYWTKWIQENFADKYNIEINWVSIGRSTEVADFTQLIAAGTAPTIIFHYDYPNILQYYSQDAYQELDENEIAYYAPTFWETMGDTIKEYGVIDDKLMVVMGNRTELVSSNYGTIIRKDWMDQVGAEMPQSIDEYDAMLTKWKEAGLGYATMGPVVKSFNFDYNYRGWPNNEEERALNSDLAVASLTWEPTMEWLKTKNSEWNNGLISPEFYLDTEGTQAKSDFLTGKAGTWSTYINSGLASDIQTLMENCPEAELEILDPKAAAVEGEDPQGRKYWPFGMIYGINADATDEERIALWMYIEWMNDPEVLSTLQSGFEGKNYTLNEEGVKVPAGYTGEEALSKNDNGDYWCLVNANKAYNSQEEFEKSVIFANAPEGYEYLIQEILDYNKKYDETYTPDTCFSVPIASLSEYSADLANLWGTSYVDLITCSPEEFDDKYAELSQEYLDAGYQEILDEKKAAYDAGQFH